MDVSGYDTTKAVISFNFMISWLFIPYYNTLAWVINGITERKGYAIKTIEVSLGRFLALMSRIPVQYLTIIYLFLFQNINCNLSSFLSF